MLLTTPKYSYQDVMVIPSHLSDITHRSECKVFKNDMLPIFTAPMSTVVDDKNWNDFEAEKIIPIIPRHIPYQTRVNFINQGKWVALSLNEFVSLFLDNDVSFTYSPKILIDIANGHMSYLYEVVSQAKAKYGDELTIMVGNIANPITYIDAGKAGVDYIRVGIGSGAGCITSSNTGIHYPMASLLNNIVELKMSYPNVKHLKIIADGGIRNYSDVVKALALGADYVMIGSLFSSFIESSGKFFALKDSKYVEVSKDSADPTTLYKLFYGMASKYGQEDINGQKTKTSEGIAKYIKVSGHIGTWVSNMISYLQSAMSYTGIKDINDFTPENVDCIIISQNTKDSINK